MVMHAILVYQWSTGSSVVDPITSVTFHNALQQKSLCGLDGAGTYLSPTSRSSRSLLNPDPGKCQRYFNSYPAPIRRYVTSPVLIQTTYSTLRATTWRIKLVEMGHFYQKRALKALSTEQQATRSLRVRRPLSSPTPKPATVLRWIGAHTSRNYRRCYSAQDQTD